MEAKYLSLEWPIKKNIDDCRESPALDIIQILRDSGSEIEYYDPFVPSINIAELKLNSLGVLDEPSINKFDATVIVTNHSQIDYALIKSSSKLIIDTRNVYNRDKSNKIRRLGQG